MHRKLSRRPHPISHIPITPYPENGIGERQPMTKRDIVKRFRRLEKRIGAGQLSTNKGRFSPNSVHDDPIYRILAIAAP